MKPYKILRSEKCLSWNGSFQWQIGICADKPKPKIPLLYFSNVEPNMEERKKWLSMKLKVVDE